MKNFKPIWSLLILVMLASCAREDFDLVPQSSSPPTSLQKEYVTIGDVPQIIPAIQRYNANYAYLSYSTSSETFRGDEDDLDLDLEHIIKMTTADGRESYSIVIKNDSEDYGKFFYENLSIILKGEEYEAFILKYESVNSYMPLDMKEFTGNIEIYDKNRVFQGIVQFENGSKYCEKIHIGCWTIIIFSDGNMGVRDDCAGGGGGSDTGSGSGSGTGSGSGGDGGGYGFGSYGGTSSGGGTSSSGGGTSGGTGNPSPSDPTLVDHTPVAPNAPLTLFQMANHVYSWLGVNDLSVRTWLRNNLVISDEIFVQVFSDTATVLPGTTESDKLFFNQAVVALMAGNEVDLPNRIIYTISKPCQKNIVKNLMTVCSPFTTLINDTFDSNDNVNVKFYNGAIGGDANAQTSPFISGNAENFIVKIQFSDSYLDNATDLSIVSITLHELVHAYLISLYVRGQLSAANSNYNTLLNSFVAFYANKNQQTFTNVNTAIHDAMEDFISKMANSIYNYALQNNIPNVDAAYCEKLAWGTMYDTDLFSTLTQNQQIDYGNTAAIEQDNLPGHKGSKCE